MSINTYIYIYILILILFSIFIFLDIQKYKLYQKIIFEIMVVILTLISGLKSVNIGGDTLSYYNAYESTPNLYQLLFEGKKIEFAMEFGFVFILSIFKSLNFNFSMVCFLFSLITMYSIRKLILKNTKYIITSLFLFYSFHFQLISLNAMRQGLGIALMLICLINNKEFRKKNILIILLLTCIHASFIILLPIYLFLDKIKLTKYNYYYVVLFIAIILGKENILKNLVGLSTFFIEIPAFRKIIFYSNETYSFSWIFYLKRFILIGLVICLYKRKKVNERIFKLYFIGNILQIILSFSGVISFRLSYPFIVLNIVLFSNFYDLVKYKYFKIGCSFIFIIWCTLIIKTTYYPDNKGAEKYVPYKLFFME